MEQRDGPCVLSVEEGVALAGELREAARFADAEAVCRKILAVAPDCADALHLAGLVVHQQGRSGEAALLMERSLALRPDRADWFNNLGIVLKALDRLDEAEAAYRRAIALVPRHANAHSNLGVLLRARARRSDAEAEYRAAIEADPEHLAAYQNLAQLLARDGRTGEAERCFHKVATLCPMYPSAQYLLAAAYSGSGHADKAVPILERWLEDEPGNPVAEHLLAACTGRDVPRRASDGCVELLYDSFAATFEAKLATLSYRAPALVGAALADAGLRACGALDVLDGGCGTGLCGAALRPYARQLAGIDLSARMLEAARAKHVYDELVKGELTEYLLLHRGCFDVIASADTLEYFGVLEDVACAAACALREGGLVVFTVEEWIDAPAGARYRLCPHGRYQHAIGYVDDVLRQAGLAPTIGRAALRTEAGAAVAGLVASATKQ